MRYVIFWNSMYPNNLFDFLSILTELKKLSFPFKQFSWKGYYFIMYMAAYPPPKNFWSFHCDIFWHIMNLATYKHFLAKFNYFMMYMTAWLTPKFPLLSLWCIFWHDCPPKIQLMRQDLFDDFIQFLRIPNPMHCYSMYSFYLQNYINC